jgi:hypothetical protein
MQEHPELGEFQRSTAIGLCLSLNDESQIFTPGVARRFGCSRHTFMMPFGRKCFIVTNVTGRSTSQHNQFGKIYKLRFSEFY